MKEYLICECCKERTKESDYGGHYCSNPKCPLNGSIDPVFTAGVCREIAKYQSENNINE